MIDPLSGLDRIWFLTWTTYGTWLPGDPRGFVSPKYEGETTERRHNRPGEPFDAGRRALRLRAAQALAGDPIRLNLTQAETLRDQFVATALHRAWRLLSGAVLANHVHLLVGVTGDPDPASLLHSFKSYGSRALNRQHALPSVGGRWWTEQGSKRKVTAWEDIDVIRRYVRGQANPLVVWEETDSG